MAVWKSWHGKHSGKQRRLALRVETKWPNFGHQLPHPFCPRQLRLAVAHRAGTHPAAHINAAAFPEHWWVCGDTSLLLFANVCIPTARRQPGPRSPSREYFQAEPAILKPHACRKSGRIRRRRWISSGAYSTKGHCSPAAPASRHRNSECMRCSRDPIAMAQMKSIATSFAGLFVGSRPDGAKFPGSWPIQGAAFTILHAFRRGEKH